MLHTENSSDIRMQTDKLGKLEFKADLADIQQMLVLLGLCYIHQVNDHS